MKTIISSLFWVIFLFPILVKGQQNCKISLQESIKPVSCDGGMDGAIRIQARGGEAPYSYQWGTGQHGEEISGVGEGVYTVTVRDKKGCVAKVDYQIVTSDENSLALEVVQKPIGNKRQVIEVTFENGQKPYAITIKKISEGYRAPVISYNGQALDSGLYTVEAFTEVGCSVQARVTINEN